MSAEAKSTFENIADDYDLVRPSYPEKLIEKIIDYAQINKNSNLLEIGSGTGQATLPLAQRGFNIVALEPGKHLSELTRQKVKEFPHVQIITSDFETWQPKNCHFDLIYSATAFHFVEPSIGYPKLAKLLSRNGSVALFWTVHVPGESPLHDQIRTIYRELAPDLEDSQKDFPDIFINERYKAISESRLFEAPLLQKFTWEETFSSERYIKLLNTHSKHQLLNEKVRTNLFSRIKDVFKPGETFTKIHLVALFLTKLRQANN